MGTRKVKNMSRGQSLTRTQSGRRILERSKGKEKINNVVLIDVDSCDSHDFIIVDDPESSEHILQRSRVSANEKVSASSNVISIDDDDDDPGNVEGGANLKSDVTPGKVSCPATRQSQNSEESDSDECEFTQERTFPFNLSKCKRTYSGKTLPRNRFGLYSDSDSSSSECDTSDCEVMEGSSGKIRELWESAAKKKMSEYARNGRSGLEDQASASGSFTDAPENVEVEKTTKQNSSTSTTPVDGTTLNSFLDPKEDDFVMDFDHTFFQGSPSCFQTQSWERANFPPRNSNNQHGGKKLSEEPSFCNTERDSDTDINHGGFGHGNQERNPGEPNLWSRKDSVDRQSHSEKVCFQDKEENIAKEHMKTQSTNETYFNLDKSGLQDEDVCASNRGKLDETQVNCDKISPDKDEGFSQEASNGRANNGVACSMGTEKSAPEGTMFCKTHLWQGIKSCTEKISCLDKDQPPLDNLSPSNAQQDETEVNHKRTCLNDGAGMPLHSVFNNQSQEERNSLLRRVQEEGNMHDIQNDIIGQREKFKETDEYKQAMEEEWASRQRELQIQAEEAQRLRTKKKAETSRLEELRETQKKDDIIGQREKFKETDEYKQAMEEEWASRQRELQIQAEEAQRLRTRKKAETSRLEEMRETQKKDDIIGQREKFKETNEYKQAMEEEWASRQRELQIQAEEAQRLRARKKAETLRLEEMRETQKKAEEQRLRKRKKAENSRLLDMKKRQKQRLEEVRETQKKDVETLNLKDEIRAEVRMELDKLELKYPDVTSLLRYLGIQVNGGLYPTSSEVHAAYKQAMLRFHPDRASKTDIRQQVEAEEKFKLISRLKKKHDGVSR